MSSDRFLAGLRTQLLDAADRLEQTSTVDDTTVSEIDTTPPSAAGARPDPLVPRRVPSRRRVSSRTRVGLLAAAAVLAVFATLGFVLSSSPSRASADVEVIRQGDELVVKLTDVETRPDEITSAAKAAGLDLVVEEVPVGPSNVGRFIGSQGGNREITYLRVDPDDKYSPSYGFRVPVDYEGQLRLQLGRAAKPGEEWAASSDATAKGEVLECEGLVGRTLEDVLRVVQDRGLGPVRVFIVDGALEIFNDELPQHLGATVDRVWTNSEAGEVAIDAFDDPARPKPKGAPEVESQRGC